jgi:nicotinate-nucleotide adenylyltransferase
MRVGLFGGSFNPAHSGHAHVARTAMKRLGLDRLIWLVSPQNPLKSSHETAPLTERMASARRQSAPGQIISDAETRLGVRYTIDTLRTLKARFPGVQFVWVMGADNLAGFHRWLGWTEIMRNVPIAVVARPGTQLSSRFSAAAQRFPHARKPFRQGRIHPRIKPPALIILRGPMDPASSTAIRAARTART